MAKLLVILSVVCFLLSLFFPAFSLTRYEADGYLGWRVFLIGGMIFLNGGLLETVIWLANPFWFFALVRIGRMSRKDLGFAIVALLLAVSMIFIPSVLVAANGARSRVVSLGPGYYLWLGAMAFLLLAYWRQLTLKSNARHKRALKP